MFFFIYLIIFFQQMKYGCSDLPYRKVDAEKCPVELDLDTIYGFESHERLSRRNKGPRSNKRIPE